MTITSIANEIEKCAEGTEIGNLQKLRARIKNLKRIPGHKIFHKDTISDKHEWAFHYGGRRELQFNIGYEDEYLRYGVAFSLETSQSLPNVQELIPSICRFNQFIKENPMYFEGCDMWHWDSGTRSDDLPPESISAELIKNKVFIFIGKKQNREAINYQEIIDFWNYLLQVYKFVESQLPVDSFEIANDGKIMDPCIEFHSGHTPVASSTTAETVSRLIDVNIRHALLQTKLYNELLDEYDENCVGTEIRILGKKIDLVVKQNNETIFYEIKTATSAKACVREAIGQLLEYCFYRSGGNGFANKLIIVGEYDSDQATDEYLELLSSRAGLPIEYRHVVL